MTDAAEFLNALWPLDVPEGELLLISAQRPGEAQPRTYAFDSVEGAVEPGVPLCNDEGSNVWVNVATRRAGTRARGGLADCVSVPALWCDLDVLEGAEPGVHRGAHVFELYEDAYRVLTERMPAEPSLIVNTGNGLSGWWLLDEPTDVDTATLLLGALKATLTRVSAGRADPSVFDVPRMMRLPGTLNHKSVPPRPVKLASPKVWVRYGADELADMLDRPEPEQARTATSTGAVGVGRPGDDYNATATLDEVVTMLVNAGCEVIEAGDVTKLARPGKGTRAGLSLTVGWVGPNVTYVWTSSWDALGKGAHTAFAVRAALLHGGDYSACARELAAMGYGAPRVTLDELPELDDVHVSECLARWLGERTMYVPGVGWHVWDGARYRQADGEGHAIMRLCKAFVLQLVDRALTDVFEAADAEAETVAKARLKLTRTYLSRAARLRVIEDAAGECLVPIEDVDADPFLLNCPNGVVDLRTGCLSAHDPALKLTKMTRAEFTPNRMNLNVPDWGMALAPFSAELRHYLRVTCGLSLLGRSAGDLIFVAYGRGGNGKGTVLGALVHALGDATSSGYAFSPDVALFTGDENRTQGKMPLRGARVVMATESGEDHYLNMERLKGLSGGDPITDRFLYSRTFVTWEPTHTLWLQTNARPRIRNTDEGSWRRLQLVPFEASHVRGTDTIDEGLRDRLRTDPANMAAVLSWAVSGAVEWLRDHELPACDEVALATQGWRDEEDAIGAFFAESDHEVTGDPAHWVQGTDLYRSYKDSTILSGLNPLGATRFKAEMLRYADRMLLARRPMPTLARRNVGAVWLGVRKLSALDISRGVAFDPTTLDT